MSIPQRDRTERMIRPVEHLKTDCELGTNPKWTSSMKWPHDLTDTPRTKGAMNDSHIITVFTCSYNRAFTLHRVYESLRKQTFRDFEWVIMNNGSTDNTTELVEKWKQEANFLIRYFSWEHNTGYHIAYNRGVKEARGCFFTTIDSDDAIIPEALERLLKHWQDIPDDSKDQFIGVTALCRDQYGKLVGDAFPRDVFDSNTGEKSFKYKIKGEKWGMKKLEVLRLYPFPEIKNGNHMLPGSIWIKIARKYNTRYVNEQLRIYYMFEDGRVDQWSLPAPPHKNSKARALRNLTNLNEGIYWFQHSPHSFFIAAILYTRYGKHAGDSIVQLSKAVNFWLPQLLWALMLPIGYLGYLIDRSKLSKAMNKLTGLVRRKLHGI